MSLSEVERPENSRGWSVIGEEERGGREAQIVSMRFVGGNTSSRVGGRAEMEVVEKREGSRPILDGVGSWLDQRVRRRLGAERETDLGEVLVPVIDITQSDLEQRPVGIELLRSLDVIAG